MASDDPWDTEPAKPPTVALTLRTSDYRGDHAADVAVAISPRPNETLEALVKRAGLTRVEDHIEVRICKEDA